jgi:16S rRNA (guanine527-N7)-methyltransferase
MEYARHPVATWIVSFEEELRAVLPHDLPNRERVVISGAKHLKMIEETNRVMNLTRIVSAHDAAVKHVLDSVMAWRIFANSSTVLDAGTGAGFPGIPLALVLPDVNFILSESVQKKARFVQSAVETLALENVGVNAARAEEILAGRHMDVVTARAVAPLVKAIPLFASALRKGTRALLYKGPDVEAEIAEAAAEARKRRVRVSISLRYELPEGLGVRTIVELRC